MIRVGQKGRSKGTSRISIHLLGNIRGCYFTTKFILRNEFVYRDVFLVALTVTLVFFHFRADLYSANKFEAVSSVLR